MRSFGTLLLAISLAEHATARSVPTSLRNLYNSIKAKGTCSNKLASGLYALDGGSASFSYCGDHLSDYNIVYLQGNNGQLADMDIDCDGAQGGPADDGRCQYSGDTQSITSFAHIIQGYNAGISDLNANVHPYVVFGNSGTRPGYVNFNPEAYGIQPLSVMAVVCGDQLIYGVWADENGDDGDHPMIGEASLSLATACYGKSMNGNNGHSETDVLYIGFPGAAAVPGKNGAKWNAANYAEFEASITALGDSLVARFDGTATCSWPGHCLGASCSTLDDCSDDLVCISGKCANPGTCSWAGHCIGDPCTTLNDCSDDFICTNGKCAYP